MAREKFKTLTEQMFYILLCLQEECQSRDILKSVQMRTENRVTIGSGTLYDLLDIFVREGIIRETTAEGRRRSCIITEKGRQMLEGEYRRILRQAADYDRFQREEFRIERGPEREERPESGRRPQSSRRREIDPDRQSSREREADREQENDREQEAEQYRGYQEDSLPDFLL